MKLSSAYLVTATALLIKGTHALPEDLYNKAAHVLSKCTSTTPFPDLLTATFEDISAGLDKGAFTAVELTAAYIARIAETQPILRAIIEVNPHALDDAAAADAMRKASGNSTTRPLLGIPIIVKDNIATARPE